MFFRHLRRELEPSEDEPTNCLRAWLRHQRGEITGERRWVDFVIVFKEQDGIPQIREVRRALKEVQGAKISTDQTTARLSRR